MDETDTEIMKHIKEGTYPAKIARILKISDVAVHKRIARMKREQLIRQTNRYPAFYDILPRGLRHLNHPSPPVMEDRPQLFRNVINYHDMKVKIPILKRGEPLGGKIVPIQGWAKEYLRMPDFPIPMTIELTTKHVILHFGSKEFKRDASFFGELLKWHNMGMLAANSYLIGKGYVLDLIGQEVISQHLATQAADPLNEQLPEQIVLEHRLGRPATTLTGEARQEARAWIDRSRERAEAESNDLLYEEKLLRMPESVDSIERQLVLYHSGVAEYTRQIKLHLKVMEQIGRTMASIDETLRQLREERR